MSAAWHLALTRPVESSGSGVALLRKAGAAGEKLSSNQEAGNGTTDQ